MAEKFYRKICTLLYIIILHSEYAIYNMKLISDFMRLCLANKLIPLSWGISNIDFAYNEVAFDVFGNKTQGRIIIREIDSQLLVKIDASEKYFSEASEMIIWLDNMIE